MSRLRLRPSTREERQLAALWFAAVACAVVLRPVWIAAAPLLRPCTFRGLTGMPCPTCGATRTVLALLELDLSAALAVNPLATAAGLVFLIGGVIALFWALLRWPTPTAGDGLSRWWIAIVIGLVLINWTYLIVTDRATP